MAARGTSGSAVAGHTLLVRKGGHSFAVTGPQHRLLKRALAGSIHVRGAEVRTARSLDPLFGTLRDDGALVEGRNADGERWTFTVAPGVSL